METRRVARFTLLLSVFLLLGMVSGAVSDLDYKSPSTSKDSKTSLPVPELKALFEPCTSNYDCGWGYCGSELGAVFDNFPSYCTNFCTPDGMEKGGVESCGEDGVCKLLDPTVGYCVECLEHSDCKEEGYGCKDNSCIYRGLGTEEEPFLIRDCEDLQNVRDNVTDVHYKLANDIDCSETKKWNEGKGFEPLELWYYSYFDGDNHTISNIYINRPEEDEVGLFGHNRGFVIKDINIKDSVVIGRHLVGCFMGYNYLGANSDFIFTGSVDNCTVKGVERIGGFAGNANNLTNISVRNSLIEGDTYVGGILGTGYLTNSISVNNIVRGVDYTGGVLGGGGGGAVVENVYFNGIVEGEEYAGGIIGNAYAGLKNSYSEGVVTANGRVGGLVGVQRSTSNIENSYSAMDVAGNSSVGTIVGLSFDGWVRECFSLGKYLVIGPYSIPSLIGNGGRNTFSSLYFYNGTDESPKWCFNYAEEYTDCVGIEDLLYFYDSSNPPMDAWDFENVWAEVQRGPPIFKWQVDGKECINDSMCSEGQECYDFVCVEARTENIVTTPNEDNDIKDNLNVRRNNRGEDGNDRSSLEYESVKYEFGTNKYDFSSSDNSKEVLRLNSEDSSSIKLVGDSKKFDLTNVIEKIKEFFF